MRTRQNGFLGVSKAAAFGWAEALASAENAAPATKAICPKGMRSFWKVAAFRLTGSIWMLSGRRAFRRRLKAVPRHVRCFQNELHHVRILNERGISSVAEVYLYWTLMGD